MDLLAHPFVAILWSAVIFLIGSFVGDLKRSWSVTRVEADLQRHAALPAHPVSETWHRQHEEERASEARRLDDRLRRMEDKIDRLAEIS